MDVISLENPLSATIDSGFFCAIHWETEMKTGTKGQTKRGLYRAAIIHSIAGIIEIDRYRRRRVM